MAVTYTVTGLNLSSPPSSSSRSCLFGQSLSTSIPTASGKTTRQKGNIIVSRRLSGLEEAMRIRRSRELKDSVKLTKRPPLRRGEVSGRLPVPDHIPKPPYVCSDMLPELSKVHQLHDDEGIARMKAAGELAARVLEFAGTMVRPSVTTNEIDKAVHGMIIDAGAYPSPLGYGGFPKSVCTSVNECMCHGIPDTRQLQDGDIINIDVTVYLNGYHGDTSKTFLCGNVNEHAKRLVKVTEECLERAIYVCKDGASFKKIGKRISVLLGMVLGPFFIPNQSSCTTVMMSLVVWLKGKLSPLSLFLPWEASSVLHGMMGGLLLLQTAVLLHSSSIRY